jgi:chromosome segregation ATPase
MLNIYSIKEILEASDNILTSPTKNEDASFLDDGIIDNKKRINISLDKPLTLRNTDTKKNIPTDIEKIILEAENSQLKNKITVNELPDNNKTEALLVENKISQKELIDDLYKKFGKKIKKNTLQLILELKKNINFLTKNISDLKQDKKEIEKNNINLNNNILELKSNEKNLESNLKQSIRGFNSLYDKHKSLKLNFNVLEEDQLYKQKKINETSELSQKLENKIKNLDEQLIEYKDNESILVSKVKKLENYILINDNSNEELTNKNDILKKKNQELKVKLDAVGHIDVYLEEITQLKLKNKDLENTIEKLKSYEDNNDQNLNIISELENKIKYYQEENIRISNQLYEANKRFDIIKSEIEVLQDQRSSLITKINSVNDVIGNSKIITNVFNSPESIKNEINIQNPLKKIEAKHVDINEEILNIFNNK